MKKENAKRTSAGTIGNDVCQTCGGCCDGGVFTWIGYYYREMRRGEQDKKHVASILDKNPWLKKLWERELPLHIAVGNDRWKWIPNAAREKCGKVNHPCEMLEWNTEKKMYMCKIHRKAGHRAKPHICRTYICDKVREALRVCENCRNYKRGKKCDVISAGESRKLNHVIPPDYRCDRWQSKPNKRS
jgi:hypothetical protein